MNFPKNSFKNNTEELNKIPSTSGIYYFYDKDENLLYIGKAKKLKFRVRDHKKCNNRAREGGFLSKMWNENLPKESKEKLTEAIEDFRFRCLGTLSPVTVDFVFHRTTRIEIEEMSYDLTKEYEEKMIFELKPLFNSQTACEEYYEL